ncbi:hypothetical protein [Stutzerimonas kunmingensis]|nr:hypothetical protein [Stutzerimonas kunmingensis]
MVRFYGLGVLVFWSWLGAGCYFFAGMARSHGVVWFAGEVFGEEVRDG